MTAATRAPASPFAPCRALASPPPPPPRPHLPNAAAAAAAPAGRWAQRLPEGAPAKGEAFYSDVKAQRLYKNYVEAVVLRRNSITGVAYRWARARLHVCAGVVGFAAVRLLVYTG